ncbi:MAG: PQQ-binding-like beta-propeller repeat protein [Candidatus Paceibacterota bacterium]
MFQDTQCMVLRITEASPAIGADGTVYFTSEDGYIYAIN